MSYEIRWEMQLFIHSQIERCRLWCLGMNKQFHSFMLKGTTGDQSGTSLFDVRIRMKSKIWTSKVFIWPENKYKHETMPQIVYGGMFLV